MRGIRAWRPSLGKRGQMTVELAVMVPVALVVALVALNLVGYVEACAAFDQAALEAIVAHGVAPPGEQSEMAAVSEVEGALEELLGREDRCDVEVRAESASSGGGVARFAVSPLMTRYVCTLRYRTWPRFVRLPGVTFEAPIELTHERELVVDRYRPGVVV